MKYNLTYEEYESLLQMVLMRWKPIFYNEWKTEEDCILWRHDIDYSPLKARYLAEIEAKYGLKSTFFILLRSPYYNALDRRTVSIVKSILSLGHDVGLHVDFDFCMEKSRLLTQKSVEEYIDSEKSILEDLLDKKVTAFSFHNPTVLPKCEGIDLAQDEIAGMLNASGYSISKKFLYASDSRGGWHRRDLPAIVDSSLQQKTMNPYLHVLTHGCLWSSRAVTTKQRLSDICSEEFCIRLQAAEYMADHWAMTLDENFDRSALEGANQFFKV